MEQNLQNLQNLQNDSYKLFAQTWQTMLGEQVKQMQATYAQLDTVQTQMREQSSRATEELGRVARDQVDYVLKLQEEWRNVASETMRSNLEMLSPKK